MGKIKYEIDITEEAYIPFEGDTLQELEMFLYSNKKFKDCCGTIMYIKDEKKVRLSIASLKEYGVYIGFFDEEQEYLSVADKTKLENTLDVWGDGLYVSEGLFISPKLAWKCICELIENGSRCKEADWITPNELPEDGNYI